MPKIHLFFGQVLILILVLIPTSIYYFYFPQYNGYIFINRPNLGKVSIYRDAAHNIPHITAKKFSSTLWGLGWVHAQDRLWQLHLKKMASQGRLSELFGNRTLEIDKYLRSLQFTNYARKHLKHYNKEVMENLQNYIDGINDFVEHKLKAFPLEFKILKVKWEKFSILDVVTLWKFSFHDLTLDWLHEQLRTNVAEIVGKEDTEILLPANDQYIYKLDEELILGDEDLNKSNLFQQDFLKQGFTAIDQNIYNNITSQLFQNDPSQQIFQQSMYDLMELSYMSETISGKGSNSWVVSGKYTKTGKPILSNDPHLENMIPSVWYQAELIYGEQYEHYVHGGNMVGLPIILVGKTNYMSWGVTTIFSGDTSDSFEEVLDQSQTKYLFENKFYDLTVEEEKIYIHSQQEPYVFQATSTRHGPIVYYANRANKEKQISLGWIGYKEKDTAFDFIYNIYQIRNFPQLQAVLKNVNSISAISQNLIFATQDNHIGYVSLVGFVKKLAQSYDDGYIKDGSSFKNDWIEEIPSIEKPHIIDPEKGFIVTANNKICSNNYIHRKTHNSFTTFRSKRITDLLQSQIKSGKKFTIEDMKNIQNDIYDNAASQVLPKMLQITKMLAPFYSANKTNHLNFFMHYLQQWDYQHKGESVAASIFNVWEFIIKLLSFQNIKDEKLRNQAQGSVMFENFLFNQINIWAAELENIFNEKDKRVEKFLCQTAEDYNRNLYCILPISLLEAKLHLEKNFGTDVSSWKWGRIRKHEYPHQIFSQVPYLKYLFQRSRYSFGNSRTINVANSNFKNKKLNARHTPNYRQIISMSENEQSCYVLDTGISEFFLSQNYDDQMELILSGQYVDMHFGAKNLDKYESRFRVFT